MWLGLTQTVEKKYSLNLKATVFIEALKKAIKRAMCGICGISPE
jgi:hypothetical protein